jgi:hypothetical protein
MKIETIMDKLDDYLRDVTLTLIVSIEEEHYELASELRDQMDEKIGSIGDMIVKYKLSKLESNKIIEELQRIKSYHIKDWYEALDIPGERRMVI